MQAMEIENHHQSQETSLTTGLSSNDPESPINPLGEKFNARACATIPRTSQRLLMTVDKASDKSEYAFKTSMPLDMERPRTSRRMFEMDSWWHHA